MSKLSDARELLNAIDACITTREAMHTRLFALLRKLPVMDLEYDPVSPDEKALQAFEDAVCYEVMIRKDKIGKNATDDVVNAIKRIRRKSDDG